ncbi:MAG: hypothetical protein QXS02_06535 [Candidatus Thermoplasmatota archaeon]
MQIKDRIVTWWIQNIITPKREIIDRPGFVVTTFTEHKQTTYLRDLFIPEKLFEMIENKIVQTYGDQGKQALYSAGKKFGYVYASMSNFPTIKKRTKKELTDFAYLFVRYCETLFAKRAIHNSNIEQKTFIISFDGYIICRNNGLGYIMTEGATAGVWAYVMQDKTIEGIQIKCQGRGDEQCSVICAPDEKLQKEKNNFFHERELPEQKFDIKYKALNEIREVTHSVNSLQKLINSGFFSYHEGILSYKGMRFFGCESHILYILEQEISKLPDGEQILFDACFEYGKLLRETYGGRDFQKFIPDFFPALGFGDVFVFDPNIPSIAAIYYPWTMFSEKSNYIIFRGIMSGLVSNSVGKNIKFNNWKITVRSYLTLTINP